MHSNFKNAIFWLIIFAAVGLRVTYFHQIKDSFLFKTPILDAKYYNDWAVEIAKGDLLGAKRGVFMMSPGYSYFLGAVYKTFGVKISAAVIVQLALGILTGIIVFLIAKKLFSTTVGLFAMALFLFYGPELFYESVLVKTVLINFVNMLALFLLIAGAGIEYFIAGMLLGFSAHLRPSVLLFAPVALVWLYSERDIKKAVIFAAGIIVLLLPVGIRNYKVCGEFIMTTAHGGMNFFTGNSKYCLGPYTPMPFARTDPEVEQKDFINEASRLSSTKMTAEGSSEFWYGEAFKFIKNYPDRWGRLVWKKTLIFFNSYEPPINLDLYFFKNEYKSLLSAPLPGFGVILALGVLGAFAAQFSFLLAGYGFVCFMSGIIFFVVSEYRFPIVPVLCIYAGVLLANMVHIYSKKSMSAKFASLCAAIFLLIWLANYDIYSSVLNLGNYKMSNLANSYFGMGVTYNDRGMETEAVKAYEKAIGIMPQAGPLVNLAIIREKHGDLDGAQKLYERAISINPNSMEALNNLGGIFYRKKDYKSAEMCFARVVMINPNMEQAKNNLELTRKALKLSL
jgi:tetratricopeptide (TPR) repeat protein